MNIVIGALLVVGSAMLMFTVFYLVYPVDDEYKVPLSEMEQKKRDLAFRMFLISTPGFVLCFFAATILSIIYEAC